MPLSGGTVESRLDSAAWREELARRVGLRGQAYPSVPFRRAPVDATVWGHPLSLTRFVELVAGDTETAVEAMKTAGVAVLP